MNFSNVIGYLYFTVGTNRPKAEFGVCRLSLSVLIIYCIALSINRHSCTKRITKWILGAVN